MAQLNNHSSRFRKGLSNPFEAGKTAWCPACRMEVDHVTLGRHQGTTYAYKRTCRRCGSVIASGVYDNVPLITGAPLSPAAVEWSRASEGEDRR